MPIKTDNPMKNILLPGYALLAACATLGTTFSGESATFGGDNILRDDVLAVIVKAQLSLNNCREINAVESKILSAKIVDGRRQVQEEWTVTACGKPQRYPISLREDAQGETDFTVGLTGEP